MCIFCKIANSEIPSYKIYEDEDFIAFLDLSQVTKGHTLVVPKKHYDNVFELDNDISTKYMVVINKVSKLLKEKLNVSAINVLNNSGPLAGQTVNHVHFHLIPRYENDEFSITTPEHNVSEETLKQIFKVITE